MSAIASPTVVRRSSCIFRTRVPIANGRKSDVESVLGESVKSHLREAALLVGLEHVDEVADQLREWGYDFQ